MNMNKWSVLDVIFKRDSRQKYARNFFLSLLLSLSSAAGKVHPISPHETRSGRVREKLSAP